MTTKRPLCSALANFHVAWSRHIGWGTAGVAVALSLLCVAPQASAESTRTWQLEIKFGPYKPSIDDEFSGGAKPFETIYGDTSVLMGMAELQWQFWRRVGSLSLGVASGYAVDRGKSLADDGTKPGDKTEFNVVPLQLHLQYQFDYLADTYNIPFVPYVKAGFDYWFWWFEDAEGETSKFTDTAGNSLSGAGGTFGWHVGGGMRFLLDWFDEASANAFDLEIGVNNSYVFVEYLYTRVDDFGSSNSIQIGDGLIFGGLAFEF